MSAIPNRVRYEVLKRDGYRCRACGATADEVKLHVDHVVPDVMGGKAVPQNLQVLCDACNGGKSSTVPDDALVADVDERAAKWVAAMKRAADLERENIQRSREAVQTFDEYWSEWVDDKNAPIARPDDWDQTVRQMLQAGMDLESLREAVRVAMSARRVKLKHTFSYFCGVVKHTLERRQETARQLLESEQATPAIGTNGPWGSDLVKVPQPLAAYGEAMGSLMQADLWVEPGGHLIHRAWGPCIRRWWFDPQGFIEARELARGVSYEGVREHLGDRHGWATVFCEDCCITERERAWPEAFGKTYAAHLEQQAEQDPWTAPPSWLREQRMLDEMAGY